MEKTFSKIEISTIKSIAKNVAPYVAKKQKVDAQIAEVEEKVAEAIRKRAQEKIEKLEAEKKSYQDIIDSMNATVKKMTGGYTTEDLVNCVKEGTGKMDEKGKEIIQTRYILKYPETIVPPTTEGAGSDFDKDAEFQTGNHGTEDPGTDAQVQDEQAGAGEMAGSGLPEETPEELMQEQAQVAEEAAADPFAGMADADPFNQ